MEYVNKILRQSGKEVSFILSSAVVSLVIYFVYEISFLQMVVLYTIQTLLLIPVSIIRSFRFDWLQAMINVFWPLVILIIILNIFKGRWDFLNFDWFYIGEEYLVINTIYLIIAIISAFYVQKVTSTFELSFLNSLILRRIGILLLSSYIGLIFIELSLVILAVVFFIIFQTIFELYILYQSLQFRKASYQNVIH